MKVKYFILIVTFIFFLSCKKDSNRKPLITTGNVYSGILSAKCGGILYSEGDQNVTEKGLCWSKLSDPTINDNKVKIGDGIGNFTGEITGLKANQTYYVRAYAVNKYGVSYGMAVKFKPYNGLVTDIDGNLYYTVIIGTQEWMGSNLKVSRYNNGDSIPRILPDWQWKGYFGGAFCHYNNDKSNDVTYGKLYNWYAVTESRKIAPIGWHIPTDSELNQLNVYLADSMDVKMKDESWGGLNTCGFSALPGGFRSGEDGLFYGKGTSSLYWSSSENQPVDNYAPMRGMQSTSYFTPGNLKKVTGLSVRCIKD